VLDAIGFPGVATSLRRRDPAFRQRILTIYEHRCAICGYDGRLGRSDLALEAAHVRWHAYDGPDAEDNGLALCAFHHKAFDRGAISLGDDRRILVSQEVHGHSRVAELLTGFAGQSLRSPILGTPPPAAEHTAWHRREVFWEPPRAS
jgi:putative restriction endonuclease